MLPLILSILFRLIRFSIISTIFTCPIILFFRSAYEKRIERKGYKRVEEKKSFSEEAFETISMLFKFLLPGYSVYWALKILFNPNGVIKDFEELELKQGKIYIPDDEIECSEEKITNTESMGPLESTKKPDKVSEENLRDIENAQQTINKAAVILEAAARVERGEMTEEDLEKLYAGLFEQPLAEKDEDSYQKSKKY